MTDLEAIEREIEELKSKKRLTYSQVRYLSWLCVIRDSMIAERSTIKGYHGSEFMEVATGINPALLLAVLDEHMDVLKIFHKKEYLSVMERLRELKKGE